MTIDEQEVIAHVLKELVKGSKNPEQFSQLVDSMWRELIFLGGENV